MTEKIQIREARGTDDAISVANLLFENDKPFIPVASLSELSDFAGARSKQNDDGITRAPRVVPSDAGYFVASFPNDGIRCFSSYRYWLTGCESAATDSRNDVPIYELAASVVRSGGFKKPSVSMHEILTFARILDIAGTNLEEGSEPLCLIACVAAKNESSKANIKGMGMMPLGELPRWLQFEHRTWNQKRNDDPRVLVEEAVYFWFPKKEVENFIERMIPVAEGKCPISRPKKDKPGTIEEFFVEFDTNSINFLRKGFGSLEAAAKHFNYEIFQPPPTMVRVGDQVF